MKRTKRKDVAMENDISPLDRVLEWMEGLPAENLHATVFLGDAVMEFSKRNWKDLTGFGRCAEDRFNGEVVINLTASTGEHTVTGLLLDGEWFVLAPKSLKKDHGARYPENSKYVPFDEVFPDWPAAIHSQE